MGDKFQARGTLESLITNNVPLQYIRDAARDKLKAMDDEAQKEKQKLEADTTSNR
jgi:hypothetical protein